MTTSTPPPDKRGSTELQPIGVEKKGGTDSFKAEDVTLKETSQSDKVPKQNFRDPGGNFKHKFSIAKEKGFGTALLLILSYIFPFVSAPDLSRPEPRELQEEGEEISISSSPKEVDRLTTSETVQLMGLHAKEKDLSSSEVKKLIKKAIPVDTKKLSKEWSKVKKKDRNTKLAFLQKVESQHIRTSDVATSAPFIKEAKSSTLKSLDTLRKEVAKDILEDPTKEWEGKLEGLKKFPINEDPTVLFNFYMKLEGAIADLGSPERFIVLTLEGMKDEQVKQLKVLQEKIGEQLSTQLSQAKEALEKQMPLEKLQKLAAEQRPPISLPQKGTFKEKYEAFLKEVNQRRKEVSERVKSLGTECDRLDKKEETDRLALEAKRKELREAKLKLPEERSERFKVALAKVNEPWERENKIHREKIKQAKAELQTLEERENHLFEVSKGRVKEGRVFKTAVAFTEENKTELFEILPKNIKEKKQQLEALEETLKLRSKEVEQSKTEAIESVEKWYKEEEARLSPKDKDLPEYKQHQTSKNEADSKREIYYRNTDTERKLSGLEREAQLQISNVYGSYSAVNKEFEGDVKRFVVLTHVENAFTEFCKTKTSERGGKSPQGWMVDHKVPDKDIKESLTSIFGHLPEEAVRSAKNASTTDIVVRSPAVATAENLGLSEFI